MEAALASVGTKRELERPRLADAFMAIHRPRRDTSRRGMPLGVRGARILVVATDRDFLETIGEVARRHLLDVVRARAEEALNNATAEPPDAAIIELTATSSLPAFEVALRLRTLPACNDLPIAFVSAENGVSQRIAAGRAGASLYLTTPADPDKLGLAVRQLLAIRQSTRSRVLVVSDDDASSARLSVILERSGKVAFVARSAATIMAGLDEARPDLVLLGLRGPVLRGLDLCRLIRNSPEWQALPTVMLVANDDQESRLAAARAGADDLLVEPVGEEELMVRIDARLDRMRMLRERFDKDVLTNLPLRRPFLERVSHCMAESIRHARPLTVALLDVDVLKSINDCHGHAAGDRALAALGNLLAARFRTEDIRGRWGGEEFALAFPAEMGASLHEALTEVLIEFGSIPFRGKGGRTFHVTFSAGMAVYPDDGASLQALLNVADRRLYEAKRTGRARVVSSDALAPPRRPGAEP